MVLLMIKKKHVFIYINMCKKSQTTGTFKTYINDCFWGWRELGKCIFYSLYFYILNFLQSECVAAKQHSLWLSVNFGARLPRLRTSLCTFPAV